MDGYHLFDGDLIKLMVCSDCNTKCKHCYISYKGNMPETIVSEIAESFYKKCEIRISGTEPLLHTEFLPIIKKVGQTKILTNGLIFKNNYDFIDELKNYGIKTIGISYHFDIHDSISFVSKQFLDELFKKIILKGLKVQVMTTLTSSNYKEIEKYCKYCYDNGIKKIHFTNYMKQGNAENLADDLILTDEQRKYVFNTINDLRKKYKKEDLYIERCGSFGNDFFVNTNFNCTAGKKSVVITPDLKVYPCIFLAEPGNEIGFYQDGKIYLKDNYKNDGKECIAMQQLNKK